MKTDKDKIVNLGPCIGWQHGCGCAPCMAEEIALAYAMKTYKKVGGI